MIPSSKRQRIESCEETKTVKKREFAEFAMLSILSDRNEPVELREMVFLISKMNKSHRITTRLLGIIATKNESIHVQKYKTSTISSTYYELVD